MKSGKSTSWAIRNAGAMGFSIPTSGKALKKLMKLRNLLKPGLDVKLAVFQLKNLDTQEERIFSFVGACFAVGFSSASANIEQGWVHFETERPYGFEDFKDGARMANLSCGGGVGYSLVNFVVFNGIDVKQAWYLGDEIHLEGLSAEVGAELIYCPVGFTMPISDASDSVKDTSELMHVPSEMEFEQTEGIVPEPGEWEVDQQCSDSPFSLPQSVMSSESQITPEQQSAPVDYSAPLNTSISDVWSIGLAEDAESHSGNDFHTWQEFLHQGHGMSTQSGEALPAEGAAPAQETGQHAPGVTGPDQLTHSGCCDMPSFDGQPEGEHTGEI